MNKFRENNPFYGKHHTEEANEKNRQAHLGKTHKTSEETKAKISNSLKGHKISEETKRKISATLAGKELPKIGNTDKTFISLTNQRYDRCLFNNKMASVHRREMCLALNLKELPKTFIVHHIDGDTHNNNIDNLALMSHFAHNRLHSHEAWNKGITVKTNKKWRETINKVQDARNKTFLKRFEETYKLKQETGLSNIKLGEMLNITRNAVANRIKKYEQCKKTTDNYIQ